jgi:hypothetical protein
VKTFNHAQRSPEWFKARRGIPTASRFDSILTPTGKIAAAQDTLINELLAESLMPPDAGFIPYVSPEMEHGMILEAEARCAFELDYAKGREVTEVGFALSDCGRFGGSPDALVGEDSGAEIKCPAAKTHIGYLRAGVLPREYKCQVHGYMIVTGRSSWHFFSYCRNVPAFHLRVERDDFTKSLADELAHFCETYNAERVKFGLQPLGATA